MYAFYRAFQFSVLPQTVLWLRGGCCRLPMCPVPCFPSLMWVLVEGQSLFRCARVQGNLLPCRKGGDHMGLCLLMPEEVLLLVRMLRESSFFPVLSTMFIERYTIFAVKHCFICQQKKLIPLKSNFSPSCLDYLVPSNCSAVFLRLIPLL